MQKFPTIKFLDLFTTSQIFFTTRTTQFGWKCPMFHFLSTNTVTKISGHKFWSLLGLCESDSVLAKIEQRVIWSNEHITKNPQWTTWRWDINADEPTETDCLAHLWDFQDVILSCQWKFIASNHKSDYWQWIDFAAVNGVLSLCQWLGSNFFLQSFNFSRWTSKKGRASISNCLTSLGAEWWFSSKQYTVHFANTLVDWLGHRRSFQHNNLGHFRRT